MCPPSYYQSPSDLMALGHMMYGYTLYDVRLHIITYILNSWRWE